MIVSAHGAVKAALRNVDAERLPDVVDALLQGFGGDHDVVETVHTRMVIHDATGE